MPGEYGEGSEPRGDGEQRDPKPETLQQGGMSGIDPDEPDIPAILRERSAEDPDLESFRPLADEIAEEVSRSGGAPLSGNALKPLLRGLKKAYEMGQRERQNEGDDVTDRRSLAELDEGAGSDEA